MSCVRDSSSPDHARQGSRRDVERDNVCSWPDSAVIGIRPERLLSGDKLPSVGSAHDD
jgi:hypothetical protein